ncbi:hypothetical protein LIER_31406 [Lithospermum erythrorhizon]|uniref:Uncharacterized protein n=1 Tax=Lithospermum erythrorhizon TaxID=34254 RepID=A0AAV3RQY9_LITER
MVRYHGKGRGKVYASSDAPTALHSCLVTSKATRPDQEKPFFYDDHESQLPLDQALFVSLRTSISSGPSKRKRSSSSTVEDRDPKHDRGALNDTSSSRGSRVASPVPKSPKGVIPSLVSNKVIRDQVSFFSLCVIWNVSSYFVSSQEHTKLVDTRGSS